MAGDSAAGGLGKANEPALHAFEYNPEAPLGQRYTRLAASPIPRMYHSTAALTVDGTILVSGCDRCDKFTVTPSITPELISKSPSGFPEYRVEIFYPPYHYSPDKPSILQAPAVLAYKQDFTIRYSQPRVNLTISTAVLVAPSATTHSNNMHQRAVQLDIVTDDRSAGVLTARAPPSANIAIPGMYMLFLCNGDICSKAVWAKLPVPGAAGS
jgi:hypothetical protein